eukprot:5800217-Ditylum_brightwellii.AAC.1
MAIYTTTGHYCKDNLCITKPCDISSGKNRMYREGMCLSPVHALLDRRSMYEECNIRVNSKPPRLLGPYCMMFDTFLMNPCLEVSTLIAGLSIVSRACFGRK